MFEVKLNSPTMKQFRYSERNCTNKFWHNRARCANKLHRQLHVWKNAAVPLLLDQVEQGTLTVRTAGYEYIPGGCGPLWAAAAMVSELDARGALHHLSGSQVAWLLGKDRSEDAYPLRGLEILRLLDNLPATGVEVWTAAADRDDRRTTVRLRDLFDSNVRGSGWAMRRFDLEPVSLPTGLEI